MTARCSSPCRRADLGGMRRARAIVGMWPFLADRMAQRHRPAILEHMDLEHMDVEHMGGPQGGGQLLTSDGGGGGALLLFPARHECQCGPPFESRAHQDWWSPMAHLVC